MKDITHIKTGYSGEDIACDFLVDKGYRIVERNVRRKWGEIDAICIVPRGTIHRNHGKIVPRGTKSVKRNVPRGTILDRLLSFFVPRGTIQPKGSDLLVFVEIKTMILSTLQPEDNMTLHKKQKLIRTCELYLSESGRPLESDWQIDVVAVVLNRDGTVHQIRHHEQAVY